VKISSELSTGVKLTGNTIGYAAEQRSAGVTPVQDFDPQQKRDDDQPDMKDAGIGRKIDLMV
jgi:hypothetical protein